MSFFTNPLPKSIAVEGISYPIRTDFRTWVSFYALLSDDSKSAEEKILCLFRLVFLKKELPKDFGKTMDALLLFYAGGETKNRKKSTKQGDAIFSLTHDAPYIYAAVLSQYGVDLTRENPHWHLFLAMLSGLSGTHKLFDIVKWRSVNLSDIKDTKKRAFYRKMKALYRLPDGKDAGGEKVADALSTLM